MKQTNQTVNRKRWMRTGAVGVVFWRLFCVLGAEPAREADGGAGDAEQFFKRSG